MNNSQIADHFSFLSKLMDIHGENSFKSKTYSIAAFNIEKLPEPLSETNRNLIAGIKGIGVSVATKIYELLDSGKLTVLQELIDATPPGVVEMLHLKGLGPKKIHTIWKEMGIQSIGELEYACNENRLTRYKGFGEKTQANVLESIKFYTQNIGHFLYSQVEAVYPSIEIYLEKLFGKNNIVNTGDFRRQMLTISEMEFVVNESIQSIKPKFETAYPPELLEETEESILYKLNNGLRLKLISNTENIYKKQFLTSASDEFIEGFFEKFELEKFETLEPKSETEIFEKAALTFVEPCLRETKGIVEKARANDLPKLIEFTDIKGIVHNHSNWSDGANTIEELATELIKNNFEYLVISDHSKTAAYANGLSVERVYEQHRYIDELNKKLAPFKIFKSIESDILNDGNLDYDVEVLKTFDLVIASVHSNLYMNKEKAMMRLLKAIENPYTTILGHPTGRLLLSRNGYPIDYEMIVDACVANNVVIEINANPHRLDLDWQWIEYAMSKNALLSIDPDAHSIEGIYDIKYGVLASQKGGLTAQYNLSSFSLNAFEKFLYERKLSKNL
ncbi:MAG: histidinol-phosphatase [Sphingobacteriales bacterium 41-5]|nr:MAG: histidinol-phosphatase [Sphingobacteriales bacterium 41-5]